MSAQFAILCAMSVAVAAHNTSGGKGQTIVVPFKSSPRSDGPYGTLGTLINATIDGQQVTSLLAFAGTTNIIAYQAGFQVDSNSSACISAADGVKQCPFNASLQIGNATLDSYSLQVAVSTDAQSDRLPVSALSFVNGGGSITAINDPKNLIGQPSIPQSLYNSGKIPQPVAALYYSGDDRTGQLVLGDPETTNLGDIYTKTVLPHRAEIVYYNDSKFTINDRFFGVPLDGILVGNETVLTRQKAVPSILTNTTTPQKVGIVIDPTNPLILLDRNDSTLLVDKLFGGVAIPANATDLEVETQGWIVPCDY